MIKTFLIFSVILLVGCSDPYIRVVEYGASSSVVDVGKIGGCRVDLIRKVKKDIKVIYNGSRCFVQAGGN